MEKCHAAMGTWHHKNHQCTYRPFWWSAEAIWCYRIENLQVQSGREIKIADWKVFWSQWLYIDWFEWQSLKINLPNSCFKESLGHTAILMNLNFVANSARSKTWSRKNISWTEMKSLLTKLSNVLPFYTSSQNSNLLYSEVDSLKHS